MGDKGQKKLQRVYNFYVPWHITVVNSSPESEINVSLYSKIN